MFSAKVSTSKVVFDTSRRLWKYTSCPLAWRVFSYVTIGKVCRTPKKGGRSYNDRWKLQNTSFLFVFIVVAHLNSTPTISQTRHMPGRFRQTGRTREQPKMGGVLSQAFRWGNKATERSKRSEETAGRLTQSHSLKATHKDPRLLFLGPPILHVNLHGSTKTLSQHLIETCIYRPPTPPSSSSLTVPRCPRYQWVVPG